MPTTPELPDVIRMEERSRQVLERALTRLKQLKPLAASPVAQDAIDAKISELELAIETAEIIGARLRAATVVVKPLDDGTAARLSTLAAALDHTIENDAVATAGFAGVATFIETAMQVRDIIAVATSGTAARAG
jgi:hypothetical protein